MSWASRFGNLGRFSPFAREPQGATKVSEADYSYITADDLARHESEQSNQQTHHGDDYGPQRDTDVLILRNRREKYPVHFPAYSIVKGELMVGQVREQAAKKIGAADSRRVKLVHHGKNLKDDSRTCKQVGLREGAEILCTGSDSLGSPVDSDDDDGTEDGIDEIETVDGQAVKKKKRNRGNKTKRRNRREGGASPSESNLNVPSSGSQQPSRPVSPRPQPTTPLGKLSALREKLEEYIPGVRAFEASPPTDPAKREFEYKKLSETILAQVLLKTDAVETEGDVEARAKRKELVREVQETLQRLDAVMKA